jgi:hypothetical protein
VWAGASPAPTGKHRSIINHHTSTSIIHHIKMSDCFVPRNDGDMQQAIATDTSNKHHIRMLDCFVPRNDGDVRQAIAIDTLIKYRSIIIHHTSYTIKHRSIIIHHQSTLNIHHIKTLDCFVPCNDGDV